MAAPSSPDSRWPAARSGALAGGLAGFMARDLGILDVAGAWILGALLGLLLSTRRVRPIVTAGVTALALCWFSVAFTPLAGRVTQGLVRSDPLETADAVLVLASRLQADGEPSGAEQDRVGRGLELGAGG